MNKMFLVYLAVPFILVLVIVCITAYYKIKDEEPIVNEVFHLFMRTWGRSGTKPENGEEPFSETFLKLFTQAYKYEGYEVSLNKHKFFLYKTMILLVIASVPFLLLFLMAKKAFIMGDNEWNDMYLYIIIVVPLMLAYLLNKYVNVKQYRDMWIQHAKIKYHLEYRMMSLTKDYEMKSIGMNPEESKKLLSSLKQSFIDEMCEYWNTSTERFSDEILPKDDNLFQDIVKMFHGDDK